ncbi:MAG: Holliday junction resolvase-like protein [Candidatus Aenigmatarchaeota archaeon]
MLDILLIASVILLLIFILLYSNAREKNQAMKMQIDELISRKHSLSTKYGKMSEQFFPFLESYPYDREKFRFIGNPIDGVQFEEDKIIFVEFKTANSQLTTRQKEIRDIVKKGRVEFEEFRID